MAKTTAKSTYPELPDQRSFTIGEVCHLCLVQRHTLRYWEKIYPELSKINRYNNRRYYTSEDIFTIRTIHRLKQEGLTSQGIAKVLQNKSSKPAPQAQLVATDKIRTEIEDIIKLLQ